MMIAQHPVDAAGGLFQQHPTSCVLAPNQQLLAGGDKP